MNDAAKWQIRGAIALLDRAHAMLIEAKELEPDAGYRMDVADVADEVTGAIQGARTLVSEPPEVTAVLVGR